MRVVVTGSASHLARALLPVLLADPGIGCVVGIDRKPTPLRHPKLESAVLDIRDAALARWLERADALIHLAFVVLPGELGRRRRDRQLIRDINVRGSAQVFETAAAGGIARILHVSSAAVYRLPAGAERITEDHPRGALPGFHYAEDKIAVEDWLDGFEARHPAIAVLRLRPHVIVGPHCQPLIRLLLRLPVYPHVPRPWPLLQCVHERDVAEAIRLALFTPARGAFNLAADPPMAFRDLKHTSYRFAVPIPLNILRTAAALSWRLAGVGADPAWLEGLRHSLVLDTGRGRSLLGWQPRFTTLNACRGSA